MILFQPLLPSIFLGGLGGLEIESQWGRDFLPVQTGPGARLLYIGYQVFPRGKVRLGRVADHSPHSSAEVLEE
jgi:hypothetical protein